MSGVGVCDRETVCMDEISSSSMSDSASNLFIVVTEALLDGCEILFGCSLLLRFCSGCFLALAILRVSLSGVNSGILKYFVFVLIFEPVNLNREVLVIFEYAPKLWGVFPFSLYFSQKAEPPMVLRLEILIAEPPDIDCSLKVLWIAVDTADRTANGGIVQFINHKRSCRLTFMCNPLTGKQMWNTSGYLHCTFTMRSVGSLLNVDMGLEFTTASICTISV